MRRAILLLMALALNLGSSRAAPTRLSASQLGPTAAVTDRVGAFTEEQHFEKGAVLDEISEPSTPATGKAHVYVDSTSGEVTVKKDDGTTASLEGGGGGAVLSVHYDELVGDSFYQNSISMPFDDTIPQVTEGVEIMSVTFNPASTTSKLWIRARVPGMSANDQDGTIPDAGTVAIFTDDSSSALNAEGKDFPTGSEQGEKDDYSVEVETDYTPGNTGSLKVSVRIGPSDSAFFSNEWININAIQTANDFGGVMKATLIVIEYEP